MTHDHARTYGGWRRSRSIGLLGLGPAATFILLGGFAALVVIAAVSLKALLYVGPPAALAATAGMVRVGGLPIAQLGIQRLRWQHGLRRRADPASSARQKAAPCCLVSIHC